MCAANNRITRAHWLRPRVGCVILERNWDEAQAPALCLDAEELKIAGVRPAPASFLAKFWGYYERHDGWVVFCQEASRHPQVNFESNPVQVAGPFNRWGVDGPAEHWRLRPQPQPDGSVLWECAVPRDRLGCGAEGTSFKFASSDWQWLGVSYAAPNLVHDESGNPNYRFVPQRNGRHVFLFDLENGRGMDQQLQVRIGGGEPCAMTPGLSFFDLASSHPLGARVEAGRTGFPWLHAESIWTVFRLFAPRARSAAVEVSPEPGSPAPEVHPMKLNEDEVTWEVWVSGNLHGWFYHLRVDGENDGTTTFFDGQRRILDPWALAAVGPAGPGIVIDPQRLPRRDPAAGFAVPAPQDLVVLEAHVRDLIRRAPLPLTHDERLGFTGLSKWIAQDGSYLGRLGINALELLPVAQADGATRETYHWGYMPTNFFSPSAHYGLRAEAASQNVELAELVRECHHRSIAVILDVVYNHVGEPAHLLFLDKAYYFLIEDGGALTNWSGCGNTLRAESAMGKRLIIESLVHFINTYDVDGFRFDLADLLTIEVLGEIERALKLVKPSVILIAEPWSFRGSIAWQLRSTGYSFWNDGFRDFIPEYVRCRGNAEGLRYFMAASLGHRSRLPAQSVNYLESHDDHCWIDRITENPGGDGRNPTVLDVHRSHLAAAILMCSLGIPMLAEGMDFLRSKNGLSNTYQQGEVNEIDYERMARFQATHDYCRQWIRFRLSPWGELLRLPSRPSEGYVRLYSREGQSAAAVLFNADRSLGPRQILFAVNPHGETVSLPIAGLAAQGSDWRQLGDRSRLDPEGTSRGRLSSDGNWLTLDPMDCGLWVRSA